VYSEARELRYFLAVADELHFGRAARRLSITAPGLSRMMRRFETDLGVELFTREGNRVRLTDSGRALVSSARDAVASLDGAFVAAREAGRHELAGVLNVGVNPLLRHRLAPLIFERFASAFPAVRVSRREEFSGPLIEELAARRIDVALDFCPEHRDDFAYERIRDAELVILISSSHPLAARLSVRLPELRDEPFLVPSLHAAPAIRERFSQLFASAGFQACYAAREIDHDEGMRAVMEGCGVALISRFSLESTAPSGTSLLELDPSPELPFELVRRAERLTPILARFVGMVRDITALDLKDI
jgi:DNA-binding transcriptional LysR family regulator